VDLNICPAAIVAAGQRRQSVKFVDAGNYLGTDGGGRKSRGLYRSV